MTDERAFASFAATLGAATVGSRLLAPRQPSPPAPVDLRAYFSAEELARGARYARPQLALGLARSAVELGAVLVAFKALGRRRRPRRRRQTWAARHPVIAAAGTAAGVASGGSAAALPLSAIARRRSIAVGLSTQSWRDWAVDVGKATAIESSLGAAGAAAVTAVARRHPRRWWAPAAAGSVGFAALFAVLGPVVLDPVFNSFEPLPDGETRQDVLALADAAGVNVGDVYSVDASRRTTAANAYVTGLGPTKRVVLFDTLLERYSRDEIRLVVAHELAHVRHRDVLRGLTYAAIVAPAATLTVQQLSWRLSPERGTAGAVPALALAAALVSPPLGLAGNRLSRAIERRADAFALELAGSPEAFVSFERGVALQNVADIDPPRWIARLLSTHPSTAERIGAAVALMAPSAEGSGQP